MNQWVNQPPSLPAGYVTSSTRLPEWAKVGSVMIRWRVGFTPSGHADKVPDSKSSANTVADGGGGGGGGGGGVIEPVVVPLATLETRPNIAFTFSVPRNAISWN